MTGPGHDWYGRIVEWCARLWSVYGKLFATGRRLFWLCFRRWMLYRSRTPDVVYHQINELSSEEAEAIVCEQLRESASAITELARRIIEGRQAAKRRLED